MNVCRQQSQGLLPPGTAFDLFRGTVQSARDEVEAFPSVPDHEVSGGWGGWGGVGLQG